MPSMSNRFKKITKFFKNRCNNHFEEKEWTLHADNITLEELKLAGIRDRLRNQLKELGIKI